LKVDLKRVLRIAPAGRVRGLDLAHDLRIGLLKGVKDAADAVGAIAVDRERLAGRGRALGVLAPIAGVGLG
jgi:hypothetical protein